MELRDLVILCYQLFLARNPESEDAVQDKIRQYKDLFSLRRIFFTGEEFQAQLQEIVNDNKIHDNSINLNIDENMIRWFYLVLLGREPENEEAVRSKLGHSFDELRKKFLSSREFLTQYNYFCNPFVLIAEDDETGRNAGKEILQIGGRKNLSAICKMEGILGMESIPSISVQDIGAKKRAADFLIAVDDHHKQMQAVRTLRESGCPFQFHEKCSRFMHIYGCYPFMIWQAAGRIDITQWRSSITFGMYQRMFQLFQSDFIGKNIDIWVCAEDNPTYAMDLAKAMKIKTFAYCTTYSFAHKVISIPDYSACYDGNNHAYPDLSPSTCMEASKRSWKDKRIFWRGSIFTSETRTFLLELCERYPDKLKIEDSSKGRFIPMTEQTKYKYLLDTRGYSWSVRLQTLLQLGRPIFLVDRPYHDWFIPYLKPMEHFIPVKQDLSDLIEKYDYIEKHPEVYEKIVNNMRNFSKKYFSSEFILNYLKEVTLQHALV